MVVPKRRTSKARRDTRRNNHKKLLAGCSNTCSNCKTQKRPHAVCLSCGYYKGKPVLF